MLSHVNALELHHDGLIPADALRAAQFADRAFAALSEAEQLTILLSHARADLFLATNEARTYRQHVDTLVARSAATGRIALYRDYADREEQRAIEAQARIDVLQARLDELSDAAARRAA